MTHSSQGRRGLEIADLFRMTMADDPQLSPDGRIVAWVRTSILADANRYRSEIVLTDLASGTSRRLTDGDKSETAPRWSPDGTKIAFLCEQEPPHLEGAPPPAETFLDRLPQLCVRLLEEANTIRLTSLRGGASAAVWSPDGTTLAFTTLVHPRRGLETSPVTVPTGPAARFTRDVLRVSRVRWKSDTLGLLGDYAWRPAVVPSRGGDVRLLGPDTVDLSSPCWSPDGKVLAVVGNTEDGWEVSRRASIFLLDVGVRSTEVPSPLFTLEEMRASDLAFSPDGRHIAVCGHDDHVKGHYGFQKLWIVDVSGGGARCVSRSHDVSIGDHSRNQDLRGSGGQDGPRWLPDGRALLVLTSRRGIVQLERVDLDDEGGSTFSPITEGDHVISAFSLNRNADRAVLRIEDGATPGEIFVLELEGANASGFGTVHRLTNENDELLSEVSLERPQRFVSTSGEVEVEGWIHMPPPSTKGEKIPVILYTGGGPGGMRANVFVHEFHLYAANGYAVLNCNARGNYGYGEEFSLATRGNWGGLDYEDNMAFLEDALAQVPGLDDQRVAVAGGSYGGYMASWILGHHPEFKAAVVDRTLFNRYAFSGSSDIGVLLDRVEFDGRYPWEAPQEYLDASPIKHVGNIVTPTLVVHSAFDYRCPVDQGEQLYMALRVRNVPSELIRFPDESHELSRSGRPWHRAFRLESYLNWFRKWM